MAQLISNASSNTSTTEHTTAEVFNALRAGHEAVGGVWPDFGAGEGDGGSLTITKENGETFSIGLNSNPGAKFVLLMGDNETA